MDTPGTEPTLTVAVVGNPQAPVRQLARALAKRVGQRHGPEAVPFLHHVLESLEGWAPRPSWAMLRLPSRLVALAAMECDGFNLHEIAWHLHQADAILLAVGVGLERRFPHHGKRPPPLRDLMLLAACRGIHGVIAFLDTTLSEGPDEVDEAERGLRRTLMMAGLPGDDLAVIPGEVGDAGSMDGVLSAVERDFRTPARDTEGPLRMVVRSAGSDGGRGRIASGQLAVGERVQALLRGRSVSPRVEEITRFGEPLGVAGSGQNIALVLPTEGPYPIDRAAVIGAPGTVKTRQTFHARVTLFRPDEGGRHRHVRSGFAPTFLLPSVQRRCRLHLLRRQQAEPGETFPVMATFADSVPEVADPGDTFILRRDGRIIGHGVVE